MPRSEKANVAFAGSAPIFAALGDATRLRLVARLSRSGPLSIARLSDGLPISRQAVTKHLQVMKDAGLVRRTERGRESLWQLEQKRLAEVRRHLQTIAAQWDETLGRLRQFVERSGDL